MKPDDFLGKMNDIRTGFVLTWVIDAAEKLEIFDTLRNGPNFAKTLALRRGIKQTQMEKLLNVLVSAGFLGKEEDVYFLTEYGEMFTELPWKTLSRVGPLLKLWEYLPDALREEKPQWGKIGIPAQDIFSGIYKNPEQLKLFCEFMNANTIPAALEIAGTFDFSGYSKILDVGGGMGAFCVEVVCKFPHLRGTVMELPLVCSLAQEYISENGMCEKIQVIEGDLLQGHYPQGFDVAILSWILHDWNDEHALQILKKVFNVLPEGGTLLISECVLDENGRGKKYAEILSLVMLLAQESGSRERRKSEFVNLLLLAGFRDIELISMNGPRDLIIAKR